MAFDDGSEFVLADLDVEVPEAAAERDGAGGGLGWAARAGSTLSVASALDLYMDDSSDDEEKAEEATLKPWTILYCSRTHSQLAQVVGEVRKTGFGERLGVVTLAGRKQLCLNDGVRNLASSERVNEACLDLQTKASKKKQRAPQPGSGGGLDPAADDPVEPRPSELVAAARFTRLAACHRQARQAVSVRQLLEPLDVEELALVGR